MKQNLWLKGLIIGGLIFLLLIPTFLIDELVVERKNRQQEAFREISSKWAETQTVTGPIVSIPYLEYFKDTNNTIRTIKRYMHFLPDQLNITGDMQPEKRYRGIYEIVVYSSKLHFSGKFTNLLESDPSIAKDRILYNEAFASFGLSDLRGIKDNVALDWGKDNYSFNSGIATSDVLKSGISVPVRLNPADSSLRSISFSMNLHLRGSQFLYFTPIGKETQVEIHSNWSTPSFDGAFLPDSRKVDLNGFTAHWKVLHLNRNYPQQWLNSGFSVGGSAFGVNLLLKVDNYTKTERSIKYAILFIGLTFLIFFFLEQLNRKLIHPVQYILVGFALCLFYTLLLSISEHIQYNLAYLVSSVMTIGLITWYSRSVLKDRKLSLLVGGNLLVLYGFIFTIIQVEDYALLMGSIGLFIILALVMHFSRKIDWGQNGTASDDAAKKEFLRKMNE